VWSEQPLSDPGKDIDAPAAPAPAVDSKPRWRRLLGPYAWRLVVAIIAIDILAFIVVPPYAGEPPHSVGSISDLVTANLEIPAPEIVYPPGEHIGSGIVSFQPSITNTTFTAWLVTLLILIVGFLATRGMKDVPGPLQNFMELTFEKLEDWAVSLGGEAARRHVPVFTAFFLFILVSNWSGLIPLFGKIEALRAPTSDVNVTLGLALVVFFYFQYQGFRALGVRQYLGKFFVLSAGPIGLFVGLIELMLEFIKPITLSMRLFGNIFGGEVALGVITALTFVIAPSIMMLLEGLLNFIQALIFSTLMLMYTVIAVESHSEEAHDAPAFADLPEGNVGAPISGVAPAH
jgi:F-type H+-transporting ATPase subunit a